MIRGFSFLFFFIIIFFLRRVLRRDLTILSMPDITWLRCCLGDCVICCFFGLISHSQFFVRVCLSPFAFLFSRSSPLSSPSSFLVFSLLSISLFHRVPSTRTHAPAHIFIYTHTRRPFLLLFLSCGLVLRHHLRNAVAQGPALSVA